MPIPDSPRVIYSQNPLVEVICQLRFPPILRIETEPPATLQDVIRVAYPLYAEKSAVSVQLPQEVPPEVAKMVNDLGIGRGTNLTHEFSSRDNTWHLTLSRDAIALRTTKYERWDEFRTRLDTACTAFVSAYQPSFYTRIGLRYVDVIQRSKFGLQEVRFSDLLKPHIAGELSASEIADEIETASRDILIRVDEEGGRVRIRHGIAFIESSDEQCFLIDSDYFTGKHTETSDALRVLDRFNRIAGQLFRWCISDQLHEALEPEPVG